MVMDVTVVTVVMIAVMVGGGIGMVMGMGMHPPSPRSAVPSTPVGGCGVEDDGVCGGHSRDLTTLRTTRIGGYRKTGIRSTEKKVLDPDLDHIR